MTDTKDKLLQAFNHMVDELHAAVEKAEEKIPPTIEEMVKNTEEVSKKLYELTSEEAKHLSASFRREVSNARDYLETEGKELNDWLRFDYKQVEGRFFDMLKQAADKNWLDFRSFKEHQQNTLYKTGEVCAPGTLRCLDCGQEMQLKANSRIPPCPKCHQTQFERMVD